MRRYDLISLTGILLISGCRTATRVAEVPRVDLALNEGGNRGYLVGHPPEEANLKTTRQMVQTDIELSWRRGGSARRSNPVSMPAMSSTEFTAPTSPSSSVAPTAVGADTYVVQPRDSLWSIAKKPEIYGSATQWRRLFDANRDLLKGNPNGLRVGMTLQIPRSGATGQPMSEEDEGMTFKK